MTLKLDEEQAKRLDQQKKEDQEKSYLERIAKQIEVMAKELKEIGILLRHMWDRRR